jgi:hypothetical protein
VLHVRSTTVLVIRMVVCFIYRLVELRPRDGTWLAELLHRDHVARAQLVSPSFFLLNSSVSRS